MNITTRPAYVGRFAPSPSGPLHFGSLIAALGSYLRARACNGKWLLRIEDIDPPREVEGAADDIRRTLELYGLHWDDKVLYQSQRFNAYQQCIDQLLAKGDAYFCQCSRKQIQEEMHGIYDGRCRNRKLGEGAVRLYNQQKIARFDDLLLGNVQVDGAFASEDFAIQRSDGLYAYQLAVVLDDAYQGVTEIVRGADLLEASCRQLSLYCQLGLPLPQFMHLPLACLKQGFKLSKQNHAQALDKRHPHVALQQALLFLGQPAVIADDPTKMLAQAVSQLDLSRIPRQTEILIGR
ncbi:tRNA glutamyl-Q(34) synthetase GluQRS [Shewanella sp. A32]|uniref:tRNA glutamyl-Q(34) synthetase GluQRS n=1 Tax=Shewanella sp. A32 TaxID=3031327 RepID=UPI0023B95A39|nr:tRNA glutamyl-Q(34) synthetase GluQRS [Shewanella sp. A32]MDF0533199.1 tRNA glutamyl-Q(34) synthetase GluQRS [Shewanella sp. A32]